MPIIRAPDCVSCRYFAPSPKHQEMGTCRRDPPVPLVCGVQQTLTGSVEPIIKTFYPGVGRGDWCGEYEPRKADA